MIKKDQILVINDIFDDYDFIKQIISCAGNLSQDMKKEVYVIDFSDLSDSDLSAYYKCGASEIININCDKSDKQLLKQICIDKCKEYEPAFIAFGSSDINKEIATAISTELEIGIVADCVAIRYDNLKEKLIFSRTAMCSSIIADIECSGTSMCTIRKGAFKISDDFDTEEKEHEIIHEYHNNENKKNNPVELIEMKKRIDMFSCDINSKVIIGIGRGALDSLDKIKEFAKEINAGIVATRPLVDDGVFDKSYQVGQSGVTISPNVYIALGISGASQHMVGVMNAKKIIAVNKDEKAPISNNCDYFICADVKKLFENKM